MLRLDGENVITFVNNTQVVFNAEEINEIFSMLNEGSEFCKLKTILPIAELKDLKRSFFGNLRITSLKDFNMSYFTPMH